MNTFALFTTNKREKNGVEAREYDSEIWINQGQLGKKLGLINISDRTRYYPTEF